MKAYMTDAAGQKWLLPPLSAWRMEYTAGVPCDSFWLRCPWERENTAVPARWVSFTADYQGERVFTGLVDECEVELSAQGSVLEVSGRGMAARLLDNEALGQDYGTATQADILRDHVTPYGIETVPGGRLPAVHGFSVSVGSSEWSVIYNFARYHGGVTPRFDRKGRLVLTGWQEDRVTEIGDSAPVTGLACQDRRYGVLSRVLVRDRFSGVIQTVKNEGFLADGIQARRVVTMPGRGSYKTMRYTGRFQLDRAAADRERVVVTLAQPFGAWPGETVELHRSGWSRNGRFRVLEAVVWMDGQGCQTSLTLVPPDLKV